MIVCYGQTDSIAYSVEGTEAVVRAVRSARDAPPSLPVSNDSLLRAVLPILTSAQALTQNAGIALRQNGPGGTTSFRYLGESVNRLQVSWAGLRVDDPQLGGVDVSALAGFGNRLTPTLTGDAGGMLTLAPNFQDQLRVAARASQGGGLDLVGEVPYRKGSVLASGHLDHFEFRHAPDWEDGGGAHLRRLNLELIHQDTLAGASLPIVIKAHSSLTERKLPNTVFDTGTVASALQQVNHRVSVASSPSASRLHYQMAYVHHGLDYADAARSLSGVGSTQQGIAKVDYQVSTALTLSSEHRYIAADHSNYRNAARFHRSRSGVQWAPSLHAGRASAEAAVQTHALFKPHISGALRYQRALRLQPLHVAVTVRRSVRYPLLDDVLWKEGGQPNLRPETGWIGSIDADLAGVVSAKVFFRHTENYLLWLPAQPFWRPTNAGRVRSQGVSLSSKYRFAAKRVTWHLQTHATMLRSYAADLPNKRLPFNPTLVGGFTGTAEWRAWTAYASVSASSQQASTYDGDENLPAYATVLCGLTKRLKTFQLGLTASNLLNAAIPNADGYPTPFRRLSLLVNFTP